MKPGDKIKIQGNKVYITHGCFRGRSREIVDYDRLTGVITTKMTWFDKLWNRLIRRKT